MSTVRAMYIVRTSHSATTLQCYSATVLQRTAVLALLSYYNSSFWSMGRLSISIDMISALRCTEISWIFVEVYWVNGIAVSETRHIFVANRHFTDDLSTADHLSSRMRVCIIQLY